MKGVRHLIQCHCILPQYRKAPEPVFHKFVVFSEVSDDDEFLPKLAQCNNCGVIHKVIDACKSEIVAGLDDSLSLLTIEEIKSSLTLDLCSILTTYKCDISVWENVKFIYENKSWGEKIVLSKDDIDGILQVKVLQILDNNRVKIDSHVYESEIG